MATMEEKVTTNEGNKIPKKDRKRLKKLQKRISSVHKESKRSGLLTLQEWQDFQSLAEPSLLQENSYGPGVHIRKSKAGIQQVEGPQHRDLLAWLLKEVFLKLQPQTSPKRKRSRKDNEDAITNAELPSWASVHNAPILQCMVTLEIQIHDNLSLYTKVVESQLQRNSKSYISLPTKWFQGNIPRSIAESLFYFAKKRQKKTKIDTTKPSRKELMDKLGDLILSQEEWEKAGYPLVKGVGDVRLSDLDDCIFEDMPDPSSIDLKKAKGIVKKIGTRLEGNGETEEELYISTIQTNNHDQEHEPRVFGMDCEMILTSSGSELGRITIVQFVDFGEKAITSKTIMDALVKPENPVLDYLTKYSGITAALLKPISTRLEQIQVALCGFLRSNDILVGHSLENDLKATRYIHPNVIDTALVFRPANKRTKFSLRHLTATLLGRKIQSGAHCSEEDALATLELAIQRAKIGESYFVIRGDERRCLFQEMTKTARVMCTGPADWLQSHITASENNIHALGYDDTNDVNKAMLAWIKSPKQSHMISSHLNLTNEEGTVKLQKLLQEVTDNLPSSAIMMVSIQQGYHNAKQVYNQKQACLDPRATVPWSLEKENDFQRVLETSRNGMVYWVGASNTSNS